MLGHRYAEGKNSLNAIRLVLAAMVIISHSWCLAWLSCRYVKGPARRWHRSRDTSRRVSELA
jgi:peptidoglycan/LPS O-acetylase OafA/YrhL